MCEDNVVMFPPVRALFLFSMAEGKECTASRVIQRCLDNLVR